MIQHRDSPTHYNVLTCEYNRRCMCGNDYTLLIVKNTASDDKSCSASWHSMPCISSAIAFFTQAVTLWMYYRELHPTSPHADPISC